MVFKTGDIVRRIKCRWNGMMIGDIDEVIRDDGYGNIELKKYGIGHSKESLELVEGSRCIKRILEEV